MGAIRQGEIQMIGVSASSSVRNLKIARIGIGLGSLLVLFLIENIWIDPKLRHRSHRIPSFVPEALGGPWFLVFVTAIIILVLLVACLVLLLKDSNASFGLKTGTGTMVVLTMLLSVQWVLVTNGQRGLLRLLSLGRRHKVVLTWQASPSSVVGYNVYRRAATGLDFAKLNASPISSLTYTDNSVQNGATYFYVARSVGHHGEESTNSNVYTVSIPIN
jgi:hypothetical protein